MCQLRDFLKWEHRFEKARTVSKPTFVSTQKPVLEVCYSLLMTSLRENVQGHGKALREAHAWMVRRFLRKQTEPGLYNGTHLLQTRWYSFTILKPVMEESVTVISLPHTSSCCDTYSKPALRGKYQISRKYSMSPLQTQCLQMVKNLYAKSDFNQKENLVAPHRGSTCSFGQHIWTCKFREQRHSTGILVTHWF